MRASLVLRSLTLNDGTVVEVPDNGVVLFVGPNNSGKSQSLRDIKMLLESQVGTGIVVTTVDAEMHGSVDEITARLAEDRTVMDFRGEQHVIVGTNGLTPLRVFMQWWSTRMWQPISQYFVLLADTESRLQASRSTQGANLYDQNPTHALHKVYANPDLAERLSAVSKEAFGQGLLLDTWTGGTEWSLRVGELALPSSPRPDRRYLDALRELPLLHSQGDGVRSMVGLLLTVTTGSQSVCLIDEPEAFLHPPQARYLGRLLSEDSRTFEQVSVMSTHSADVVHGVLEGPAGATVVRIRREGNRNVASVLDNDAVRRLWTDSLLRYSNLLEGLFTDAVVVCESDADCKFFASIRDTMSQTGADQRRPDILFTSCGGKHRMHVGVEALRAASVPVAVIGDFDVLNEWSTLSRLVEKAGGVPEEFESDWQILNAALVVDVQKPSKLGLREAVNAEIDAIEHVNAKSLEPVRRLLRVENGWDRAKKSGIAGVPSGDPHNAAMRILDRLRGLQIFLIPAGEMESLIPSIGNHGPAWLAGVLESQRHEGPEGDGARSFFAQVVEAVLPFGGGAAA